MYAMDARQYDPAIGRWTVLDPIVHESASPYNAFDNNPVFFKDPSGASAEDGREDRPVSRYGHWSDGIRGVNNNQDSTETPPDDITVNAKGKVDKVVKKAGKNKFFDIKTGKEIKPNDPSIDNKYLTGKFKIGDQVYTPVSLSTLYKFALKAGIMPFAGLDLVTRYSATALSSHTAADFGYNQFMSAYNETYENTEYGGGEGNGTFYRFEGTNTMYNLGDAGNFTWGFWMRFNNFSYTEVKWGSQINSIFTLNGFDTSADQRALTGGFYLLNK